MNATGQQIPVNHFDAHVHGFVQLFAVFIYETVRIFSAGLQRSSERVDEIKGFCQRLRVCRRRQIFSFYCNHSLA